MDAAWNGKTISSQNIYCSYMRGDSIFVDLINNSIHFQKLFRKEILTIQPLTMEQFAHLPPLHKKHIPIRYK